MPEGKEILYLTEDLHTGFLNEASYELLETTLQVTKRLEDLVEEVEMIAPETHSQGIINGLITPTSLPDSVQQRWDRREVWVGRFLHTVKVISSPERADMKASSLLQQALPLEDVEAVENFLFATRERLNYLRGRRAIRRLGSLKLGAYSYVESRVLRKALFEGVYLTPSPKIPNLN